MAGIAASVVAISILRPSTDDPIEVRLYLNDSYSYIIPELYIGHSIDASIIVKTEWESVDFNNEKLVRAMKLISPSYIRFGGVFCDFTVFEEECPKNFR